MQKEELINRIHQARDVIKSICDSVSNDMLESLPGPQPGWTAKDVLANLTFWEHRTIDRLRGRLLGNSWGDVDSINADLLRKSRRTPVARVLLEFSESGKRLIAEIQELAQQELLEESPWKDGKLLWEHIADDTFDHYEEHLGGMRKWSVP